MDLSKWTAEIDWALETEERSRWLPFSVVQYWYSNRQEPWPVVSYPTHNHWQHFVCSACARSIYILVANRDETVPWTMNITKYDQSSRLNWCVSPPAPILHWLSDAIIPSSSRTASLPLDEQLLRSYPMGSSFLSFCSSDRSSTRWWRFRVFFCLLDRM